MFQDLATALLWFSTPSVSWPLPVCSFPGDLLLVCHRPYPRHPLHPKHLLINWPPAPSPWEVSGEPGLGKLKLREVKWLAKNHPADQFWIQKQEPDVGTLLCAYFGRWSVGPWRPQQKNWAPLGETKRPRIPKPARNLWSGVPSKCVLWEGILIKIQLWGYSLSLEVFTYGGNFWLSFRKRCHNAWT